MTDPPAAKRQAGGRWTTRPTHWPASSSRYLPQTADVVAYLDGNSLGRPLVSIAERLVRLRPRAVGRPVDPRLVRGLDGAAGDRRRRTGRRRPRRRAGQTVIADSTTVNFYKSMRAAINLRPGRRKVVIDRDNFPTNRYVVESLVKDLGLEAVWLHRHRCRRNQRRRRAPPSRRSTSPSSP